MIKLTIILVSKSPFLKILNKVELINLIKNSELSIQNNRIVLSNLGSSNQLIKFFLITKEMN